MATTGTYILQKSTQLCTVVRTNVNLEEQKLLDLPPLVRGRFKFPDGAATLPPRLPLSSLRSAIKLFCHKVRVTKQKRNVGWRSLLIAAITRAHDITDVKERHARSCDTTQKTQNDVNCNMNSLTCSVAGNFAWSLERITDQELARYVELHLSCYLHSPVSHHTF